MMATNLCCLATQFNHGKPPFYVKANLYEQTGFTFDVASEVVSRITALFRQMVRQTVTYLLITSLLLQLFSREAVVMSFELNREFIAKTLCENRDRPSLHCEGQCYLAKKLKAQQEREDRQTKERIQNLPTIVLAYSDLVSFTFSGAQATCRAASPTHWMYLRPACAAYLRSVFQPPRLG
jgi:hypothetical protein